MQALGKLEAVPDMAALDWRGTAEATVRATLAGGAPECDVLVLRHERSRDLPEGKTGPHGRQMGVGGAGWGRRGAAWTRRFVGSVGVDGRVVLKAVRDVDVEEEDDEIVL